MKLVFPLVLSTFLSYGQTSVLGKWMTVDESREKRNQLLRYSNEMAKFTAKL